MEMDEEYIDNVKNLIEQKDAENVKALLIDLHPADIAELCNDLSPEEARFVYRPGGQPVLLYHVFVLLPRNTLLHQLVYGIKKRLRGTRRRLKG